MDITEIKEYLEANKDNEDVKGYMVGLKTPTTDDFKAAAENNEDVKKYVQSVSDQRVTGAIKTYEENTLPTKLRENEELVRKQFKQPEQTPEQKELKELKEKFAESEKKGLQAALKSYTMTNLTAEGLSQELADLAMGNDEGTTKQRIANLKKVLTGEIEKKVTETLGQAPPPAKNKGGVPQLDLDKMSMDDYAAYFKNRNK